jgi:hypothetical protein
MSMDEENVRGSLYGLLLRQPGLLISLSYLVVSLLGMFFTWSLYDKLGVNYLQFAEVSDFLMAVLREPATLLMAATAVAVTLLLRGLVTLEQRYFARHPPTNILMRAYRAASNWSHRNLVLELGVFLLYSFLFINLYGNWKSEQLRSGKGDRVSVQFLDQAPMVQRIMLGGSSRYLFLFDSQSGQVQAVPHENILKLDMVVSAHKDAGKTGTSP